MRIWIDFANSPHPLLFEPVIAHLEELGHDIALTVRDTAQTLELARERWPDVVALGGMTPRTLPQKAVAIGARVRELHRWARRRGFDLALSHNSYAQIVAARMLRVSAVTTMDFEYQQANHLAFRLAQRILLPEALPLDAVRSQGATPQKVIRYAGFKEELVFAGFAPDAGAYELLGVERPPGGVLVVARTPNTRASYLQERNPYFVESLRVLAGQPHVRCILLVRHDDQRATVDALGLPNVVVPRRAADSRSLMYAADLVLGFGGTMTRKAAILGVPTLTAYGGEPPAVDRWLEEHGMMERLTDPRRLMELRPREQAPRPVSELRRRGLELAAQLAELAIGARG